MMLIREISCASPIPAFPCTVSHRAIEHTRERVDAMTMGMVEEAGRGVAVAVSKPVISLSATGTIKRYS